ncbi:MAG: hypothetical protein MI861_16170, partial [Pirellulales bacterium]|nr:hypothetical protein [Pirellulales bacterium]
DYLWFLSDGLRWLMSATGYAFTLAVMWWQGLGRWGDSDPKRLARQLESAEPRLREDLLSAVELADPALVNGSEGFHQRLQRHVARRVSSIDVGRLLPLGLVQVWFWIVLSIACVCLVLSFVPKLQFGRRMARAMLPGLAIQRASLTELEIIQPQPPSRYVAEGDAVGVVVQLSGAPDKKVTLRWYSEEGLEGETEMTPRMDFEPETSLSQSPQRFAANLSVGSIALHYQVLAGDAITLWHTLTPLPRPRVESFQKRFVFPHYAKLSDRVEEAEHGDLKALVGTTAEVTVNFDEPVENAILRFANHGIEVPLDAVDESGQRFVTSIPIKTPSQYQIDATSVRSGLSNPFSPQYAIIPVIDSPPVVRWAEELPNSMLVSPLDVVSLAATAVDDLPMDRAVQEFIVNSNAMLQRELEVQHSGREFQLNWDWDLLRRTDGQSNDPKLSNGDIVLTRTVAIDRRGNRGESRWIELLVTDEGFDSDRHDELQRLSGLTAELSRWADSVKKLADQVHPTVTKEGAENLPALLESAQQLREEQQTLLKDLQLVLSNWRELPQSSCLELAGQTLIDLDGKLADVLERWSEVVGHDHPAWERNRDRALREVTMEFRRIGQEAARLDQLGRALFGQQLTVGVVADGLALRRSLEPMVDPQHELPANRFGRHLVVAVGRLEAMTELVAAHETVVPDSTRRHLQSWLRWADSWSTRLRDSLDSPMQPGDRTELVRQFASDLTNQIHHGMVDGQLLTTLNNMFREIQKQLEASGEKINRLPRLGEAVTRAVAQIEREEDSDRSASLHRDHKLAKADWNRAVRQLRTRLIKGEALHRSRAVVDLQYAADLELLDRALENVSQNGFQPYKDEPAQQVYQNLGRAFQVIQAKHRADALASEMAALLDAERRLESEAQARIMHPWWLERFSVGMEWPIQQLKILRIPWEEIEPLEHSRYNDNYHKAHQRISPRRWSGDALLTADAPLTSLQHSLSAALEKLEPRVTDAREVIQRYVLSLPEQARQAAEKAKEARQRTDSREDSDAETAVELARQQQDAELAAMETVESLVDLANTADLSDQPQRELARDADVAATEIQDALERAQEQIHQASQAGEQSDRDRALENTESALQRLADALEQTANHFERAETGQDLSESRQSLRSAEDSLEISDDLQQRYDRAEAMAELAQSDPQQLMDQLEQELQSNQPMRQELSEIAQQAAEAAQRTLEQAARDEDALNHSLERSDPNFQEQKRRIASQLGDLARQARSVDQALLTSAERAISRANDSQAKFTLGEAQKEIRKAVKSYENMGGDNALLSQMQQTMQEMSAAVSDAQDALKSVDQRMSSARERDIHRNDEARDRAADQVQRFQREAKDQRIRAAKQQVPAWQVVERDANRRIAQAQREKRDAESGLRRTDDQIKKNPDSRQSLQQNRSEYQRRIEASNRAESSARETREFAEAQKKKSEQRVRELQREKIRSLEKPNPAAELGAWMSELASEELESIQQELSELTRASAVENELRAPASRAQQFAQQQQRIGQDVANATDQLERAARHEQRLGQNELAEQLQAAADMIAENAMQATRQAAETLQQAAENSGQSPAANQDVNEATEQIRAAADNLAGVLAEINPGGADQDAMASESAPSQADGQQLARTLDELDRALNAQAPSQQGGAENGQAQNASSPENGQQGPPQDSGDQPQQPGPASAADASPTLANAMNNQSQQAARQRQEQINPSQPGDQSGQPSNQASQKNNLATRSGT